MMRLYWAKGKPALDPWWRVEAAAGGEGSGGISALEHWHKPRNGSLRPRRLFRQRGIGTAAAANRSGIRSQFFFSALRRSVTRTCQLPEVGASSGNRDFGCQFEAELRNNHRALSAIRSWPEQGIFWNVRRPA